MQENLKKSKHLAISYKDLQSNSSGNNSLSSHQSQTLKFARNHTWPTHHNRK